MKNIFEQVVFLKILENSVYILENIDYQFSFIRNRSITAINLSAAITLDLLFPNQDYKNFNFNYLVELIESSILENLDNKISKEIPNFFNDDFIFNYSNKSYSNWDCKKDYKNLIKTDIILFNKELLINKSIIINNLNKDSKKIETFIFYNIFISYLINPLINDSKNHEEQISLIKNKLNENDKFKEIKSNFCNEINFVISQVIRNHNTSEFINQIKFFKNQNSQINETQINKNCYIATLAYNDINHPKVEFLRNFRDNKLDKYYFGKKFIQFYYSISPSIVGFLKPHKKTNFLIKKVLDFLIYLLKF